MREVFADTHYWIATINPRDQWHDIATRTSQSLGATQLVTTDDVLVEVLSFFAAHGPYLRENAARTVRSILQSPDVETIFVAHDDFLEGLALYESRQDKTYSLTDCISMNIMRERGIAEVLTHDNHFAQEGFTVLL